MSQKQACTIRPMFYDVQTFLLGDECLIPVEFRMPSPSCACIVGPEMQRVVWVSPHVTALKCPSCGEVVELELLTEAEAEKREHLKAHEVQWVSLADGTKRLAAWSHVKYGKRKEGDLR